MAAEDELKMTNAVNGVRARRFGGAVNYAATPVQAPAPNISTAVPQVPNVQPMAPVQPKTAATPTPVPTQPVAPVQPAVQQMPARPGVTANPLTDPYAYIEQMYGPRETPEEQAARDRREYNNQRIANMLGLFTGIGNMLVTSSNRYGRAVKSPDLAEAADKGIMTRELQRREREKTRLEAVQKQQALDNQREKMRRDAEDRAWNRAYKVKKDAADDKWRREKDARDAAYRKSKDDADMSFKREQAKKREEIDLKRLEEQRRRTGIIASRGTGGSTRSGGSRSSNNYTDVPVPGYDKGVRVSKTAWNSMKKRQMYSELVKDNPKWFADNGWGERSELGDISRLKEDELEQAIVQYIHDNPDSEASKRAIQELVRMRDSDPDEEAMNGSRGTSGGSGSGEESDDEDYLW